MTKEIKDKEQNALQVGSFPFPLEDPGLFVAYGFANGGIKAEDLEASMQKEIDKVMKELITENEFQKIKNQVETDYVTRNSTMAGIAENLANYFVYYGDANLINTELQRFMKVTREDIKRVANKYLTKENRVVLYYLPKSAEKK